MDGKELSSRFRGTGMMMLQEKGKHHAVKFVMHAHKMRNEVAFIRMPTRASNAHGKQG